MGVLCARRAPCATVVSVSGTFEQACTRLRGVVAVARLDPWTAALVSELAATGVLDGQFRRGRRYDLVTSGKVRYEQWVSEHQDDPAAGASYQALRHVVSEVRAWKSLGNAQLQAALEWTGQLLLERLDGYSRPVPVGVAHALLPGLWPGDPAASARGAAAWWSGRTSASH